MEKIKRMNWNKIGLAVVFVLAAVILVTACRGSHQSMMAIPLQYTFVGEYSQNGSEWKPLQGGEDISAYDGDLFLRGNFDFEVIGGGTIYFYLNHIGMILSVNGEEVYYTTNMKIDTGADLHGKMWDEWLSTDIKEGDLVEIQLHNFHSFGNISAYEDFLKNIYGGSQSILEKWLSKYSRPFWIAGICMLVVSLVLIGMALCAKVLCIPFGSILGNMGFLAAFMGGYILLDTIDISIKNDLIVFNTYARQLCIMFSGLELGICITEVITEKIKKVVCGVVGLLTLADGLILLPVLLGKTVLYDTTFYWVIAQTVAGLVLLVCCLISYRKQTGENKIILVSCIILLLAMLFEFFNSFMDLWQSGICIKITFILLFAFHLIRSIKVVPKSYLASKEAEKLTGELRNSRIVLALSQIRTHFIFNVLNAISGMCKYDPEKADETVVRFARYLRNNIDIMQEDEMVLFTKELEHLEDYVILEQVRFGDKIQFQPEMEETDFKIPPLVLQPIVENAIKHGLLETPMGGTIRLHTGKEKDNIIITVTDDGAGFEPDGIHKKNSVGLDNVSFRLKHMVNGRLEIESSPGKGTTVTIIMPCSIVCRME